MTASCASGLDDTFDGKHTDAIDPDHNLSRDDFRNLHDMDKYPKVEGAQISANVLEPPIPDLAEILAAPKPPKIAHTQLVSVAVTDDVPLKDVLLELARLADIEVEVDPGITGGITFRAKDRPFNEVIDRIANMAGLRYRVKNNVLRVERDEPYIHTYMLEMLNLKRESSATIGVTSSGSGGGSSSGGGSGGASGGASAGGSSGGGSGSSNSQINAESKSDFWEQFEDSVKKILQFQPNVLVSTASIATQPQAPADPNNPNSAALPAILSASPTGNSTYNGVFYSLNKQAGTLTVSATDRQHEILKSFLGAIQNNAASQVLIEAKIIEVALNDRYQTGINWSKLGTTNIHFSGDLDPVTAANAAREPAAITILKDNFFGGNDLSAAVKLLDEFGTTRALSSPRLHATNNQQAVLSFVENVRYFKVTVEYTPAVPATATSPYVPAVVETSSDPQVAPVGLVLTLQPSINKETNEVALSVRPTITKITKFVPDPGFEIQKAIAAAGLSGGALTALLGAESLYPQVESRELDSILKVHSGQIMVIGGLLEDSIVNNDAGVPGVGEVPILGNLFKSVEKVNKRKELIILMRATIVDANGYMDKADKNIYQKFIQDPRPIEFPAQE